jgi:hypothetical protein
MTIGAGFILGGKWILLCSDTEYTHGTVVYSGPKIFTKTDYVVPVKTAFVVAGSIRHARQAIRRIEEVVNTLPPTALTHGSVLAAVEGVLEPIFDKYRQRSDWYTESSPAFWLLLALWVEGEAGKLYISHEDVFNLVKDFDFIGTGDTFARYVVKPLFESDMNLLDAITLANFTLSITKENATGCGKRSDFAVMSAADGRIVGIADESIADLNALQKHFHKDLHRILFSAALPWVELKTMDAQVEILKAGLVNIKEQQKQRKEAFARMREAFAGYQAKLEIPSSKELIEAVRLSIEQTKADR